MRIFFATDVHGSEVCWRKFLNAGAFHKADVLIMGGDMTGKAMVPIVATSGGWELSLQEQRHELTSEDEVRAMEKRIGDRGYYPVRLDRDEIDAWAADPTLVDARFKAEILRAVERWMALADERLAGSGIRCVVSPANDDMFEIDPIIERAERVELGEANTIELEGLALVSTGWANPTPWNTFREMPEPELRARIDEIVGKVPDPGRAIFNFHAPPYGSNLDNAPKLDANMNYVAGGQALIPVGSRAVRDAILAYRPPLSLHGHIHEGKGAVKLGATLAVNPGSSYEDGVLQAAIVDLDTRKGTVKRYLLING
jgi:Icc-related predicted phosphoesterase